MDDLEKLLKSAKMRKAKKQLEEMRNVLQIYEKHAKKINQRGKMATKSKQKSMLKGMR